MFLTRLQQQHERECVLQSERYRLLRNVLAIKDELLPNVLTITTKWYHAEINGLNTRILRDKLRVKNNQYAENLKYIVISKTPSKTYFGVTIECINLLFGKNY